MMCDIRRICENPTEEDRQWFPEIAGSDWLDTIHFAMQNFKDESFILQYLSPKVIRDLKLFSILDDEQKMHLNVEAIHDEGGYHAIRKNLAAQYDLSYREPNIQVYSVDIEGDRSLTLHHYRQDNTPLNEDATEVLKHLRELWGFDVYLHSLDSENKVAKSYACASDRKPSDDETEYEQLSFN